MNANRQNLRSLRLVSYQEGVFGACDGVLFPTGDSEGIGERDGRRGRAWHSPVPVDRVEVQPLEPSPALKPQLSPALLTCCLQRERGRGGGRGRGKKIRCRIYKVY